MNNESELIAAIIGGAVYLAVVVVAITWDERGRRK